MRHRYLLATLGGLSLLGAATCVLGLRWAEDSVVERLARRGFDATVGGASPRFLGIGFRDLRATHRSGVMRATFPDVEVQVGWSGASRVLLHGGDIEIDGDVNEVRAALLGDREPSAEPAETGRTSISLAGQGVSLRWQRPLGDGSRLSLAQLGFSRDGDVLRSNVGLVEARRGGSVGRFENVGAEVSLKQLAIVALQVGSGEVSVDLEDIEQAPGEAPPEPAPGNAGPARTSAKSVKPFLGSFPPKPGRGQHWRHLVSQATGIVARRLPSTGALEATRMTLSLRKGEQVLTIGPGTLYARRGESKVQLGFSSNAVAGHPALDMHVETPLAEGPVELRIKGGPVALAELGVKPGNFGLQEVERTTVELDTQVTLSADGAEAEFGSVGQVRELALQLERLAPHALTGIELGWSVGGLVHLDGTQLTFKADRLSFGKVGGVGEVRLIREVERLLLSADFRIEHGACEDMFDALPQGAVPLLAGARMSGDFNWHGGIHFDTDHLLATKANWAMRNHCRFTRIPADAHPDQFRSRFSLHVPDYDGQPLELRTGPGSSHWASLEEISPFMEIAVLTTEDGGFWTHHGFDSGAIEGAIRRNLERGEFSRGASTISMQLAKNLYLEREKYVARKVQEALLTMLIEQELRKPEILELYFNVIEYGPGVYGIRHAAKHYFASTPSELTVAQSFFLASILPRPNAQYFDESGHVIPLRASLVRNLMKIATDRHRLSPEDLEKGLAEELRFGVPSLDSNPYRNPDGSAVSDMYGSDGEQADRED